MIRLFHPPVYQGPRSLRHRKGYFEGWYYKFVTADNRALAVIPGLSLGPEGATVFIQTIDGSNGTSTYNTFRSDELSISYRPFSLQIGGNRFTLDSVSLGDRIPLSGAVDLIEPGLYRTTLLRPGIMGWYRYVPFMECYHGVVSTGHGLSGSLSSERSDWDFSGGRGYIEKDWGTSFPSSYVWMQSNSFNGIHTSFMLSLARIPWFGSWFPGFLGFLNLKDRTITFSTYTGAKLSVHSISGKEVSLTVEGRGRGRGNTLARGEILKIKASRETAGELLAPQTGAMDRRISESIDGKISLEYLRDGKTVFTGRSENSGLEIVGDKEELTGIS